MVDPSSAPALDRSGELLSDGRARKERSTFRLEYRVSIAIEAPPDAVFRLLSDADGFARWNSTVESVEGRIAAGETIRLRAKVAPDRVFKLKVAELEAPRRMVWADGFFPMFRGVRTYTLTPEAAGTVFAMVEVFQGLMLPMIAGSLPDFGPPFEDFAADLKKAAEAG
ncbi:MAG: SRPBCC domain-containing protein [Myxococcota bacterium]